MKSRRIAWSRAIFVALLALDLFAWTGIVHSSSSRGEYLFAALDVGQGDAELIRAPSGAVFMTDAGPDGSAARALDRVLPAERRVVDVAVITHAQRDHYGGLLDIIRRYRVGIVLWNGREPEKNDPAWEALRQGVAERDIPFLAVGAGDRIRHGAMTINILSPDSAWRESGEPNDTGIVQGIATPAWTALLTADIAENIEDDLRARFDLRADILKVGHHGSKYSSSAEFLSAVSPAVAVIGVGSGNRYGHPAPLTLERLAKAVGEGRVFRTDRDGTIRIIGRPDEPLEIFTEHSPYEP